MFLFRFKKTADVVEKEPWSLTDAANSLRAFVDANVRQVFPPVTMPEWWMSSSTRPIGVVPNPDGYLGLQFLQSMKLSSVPCQPGK